jgi:transcriptional regulator with XRE-family HTH domain
METLAANPVSILRRVRLARGWSYRKVAELTGGRVSHESVRQLELGLHESQPQTVAAIAQALGVPFDLLDIEAPDDRQRVAT